MPVRRRGIAQADEYRVCRPDTAVRYAELRRRLGLGVLDRLQWWLESTARYEQLEALGRRPMIVVANADDWTLGCGWLIAAFAAQGILPARIRHPGHIFFILARLSGTGGAPCRSGRRTVHL